MKSSSLLRPKIENKFGITGVEWPLFHNLIVLGRGSAFRGLLIPILSVIKLNTFFTQHKYDILIVRERVDMAEVLWTPARERTMLPPLARKPLDPYPLNVI